jgi:ketosteroid isomerase-like protein
MKLVSLLFLMITSTGIFISGCSGNSNPSASGSVKDSSSSFDAMAMKKTIEEKNTAFAKAFVTGDSAKMVNNYTQDGKLFPPNSPAVIGRAAISALVSQYLKFGIKEFRDETTALYGNEDNLIEEGNYFMGDGKGHTIDKGNYVDIWRKVDGDWKVYSNMFNSSMPATAAK